MRDKFALLDNMSSNEIQTSTQNRNPKIMLSLRETGAALGLGASLTYKLVQAGEIPSKRFGRTIRIPRAWVEAQAAASNAQ